jgi:hypothetical protein
LEHRERRKRHTGRVAKRYLLWRMSNVLLRNSDVLSIASAQICWHHGVHRIARLKARDLRTKRFDHSSDIGTRDKRQHQPDREAELPAAEAPSGEINAGGRNTDTHQAWAEQKHRQPK